MTTSDKPGNDWRRHSLRHKLIALVVTVSVFSAGLVGIASYLQAWQVGDRNAMGDLAAEAELHAELILVPFNDIRNVAKVLADTSPIHGLLRTLETEDRTDPFDGSTEQQWRSRLERLFISFLKDRPHYTQARFIILDDSGREMVRVNSTGGVQETVSVPDLQRKGNERYMLPLYLNEVPEGYFSDVTTNREFGRVEEGAVETIRYIKPVRDAAGAVRAAVVLNADFEKLLSRVQHKVRPGHVVTVKNTQGDYVEYLPGEAGARLQFHQDRNRTPSAAVEAAGNNEADTDFVQIEGMTAYSVVRPIPKADGLENLRIVASAPDRVLYAGAFEALNRNVAVSVAIIFAAVLFSLAFAAIVTRPLKDLTRKIRERPDGEAPISLDISSRDEIGDLAEAFQSMSNKLISSSALARAVFDNASLGIVLINERNRIVRANSAMLDVFGYANLEGQLLDVLIPEESRTEHAARLQQMSAPFSAGPLAKGRDVRGLRADGSLISLEVSLATFEVAGTRTHVGIVQDVTRRKEAEQSQADLLLSLQRAKAELERSNEELDAFAYVASHDLKAPLRVIDNASRWLEEDLAPHLDDDSRESMDLLRGRVKRMERLLDDLLQHSRIGRETHASEIVTGIELKDFILGLIHHPAAFVIVFEPPFDRIVLPRMPLQNVLLNLLTNAIKHNDREDGTVQVSVEERDDHFVFAVIDNGPGIAAKYHDDVFRMFKTLRPRDQVEGSGMGLAMVQKTVTMIGGTITLASEEGKGCRFSFTWPKLHQTAEDEAA